MSAGLLAIEPAPAPSAGKHGGGRQKAGGKDDVFGALVAKTADTSEKGQRASARLPEKDDPTAPTKPAAAAAEPAPADGGEAAALLPDAPLPLIAHLGDENEPAPAESVAEDSDPAGMKRADIDMEEAEEAEPRDALAVLMAVVMPAQPVAAPAVAASAEPVADEASSPDKADAAVAAEADGSDRGAPPVSIDIRRAPGNALAALLGERHAQGPLRDAAQQAPARTAAGSTALDSNDASAATETDAADTRKPVAPVSFEAPAAKRENAAPQIDQKVTIVSQQVAPAPAAPVATPSPTGAALVASLESDGMLRSYASDTSNTMPGGDARPVTTLKLQLHPAELGNVTVKISGTGEEIAIEIQVESTEARQRLSSDSEAIAKSLRGLGYDVDRITVQQVAPAASTGQQQGATSGGRGDGFSAFDQRGGERSQGQQNNGNSSGRGDGQHPAAQQAQADRGGAAGAVYI